MKDLSPIERLLAELRAEVSRRSWWTRRTLLAEVCSHLQDAADEEQARGLDRAAAEQRACDRFGSAADYAGLLRRDRHSARRGWVLGLAAATTGTLVVAGAAIVISTTAPSKSAPHSLASGVIVGRLVIGGSGLDAANRPVSRASFDVSPVTGGVYRITTDANGRFRFRGQSGVYYAVMSNSGSSAALQPFHVIAGTTTHVVIDLDSGPAWKSIGLRV